MGPIWHVMCIPKFREDNIGLTVETTALTPTKLISDKDQQVSGLRIVDCATGAKSAIHDFLVSVNKV